MNIHKITIKGLYGYINKEVKFNKDITLLVGINGSGKTSILNLINWIIKPSLANLCLTEFERIDLSFSFKSKDYQIICTHSKTQFKYELVSGNETFNPLTVENAYIHPKDVLDEKIRLRLFEHYSAMTPSDKEKSTWEFINTLPNPIIVGLDRSIYTEEQDKLYIEERRTNRPIRELVLGTPLERVKEIVNTEYRKKKDSILKLTDS